MSDAAPGKGFAVNAAVASNGKGVHASEILIFGGVVADTETVTVDTKVYTFQTTLTNVDGNVKIGATEAESRDNLTAAINLDAGAGTAYATAMTLHPTCEAIPVAATDNMTAKAKTAGTAGNSIACTETLADGGNIWTAAATTLSGGLAGMSWRTAIVLGAADGVELKTESITQDSQLINSEGSTGVRSRVSGDRGNTFSAGDATFDLLYTGLETFFGVGFGAVTAPVQQNSESAWLKTYTPAIDLTGLMATLVIPKNVRVWEYPSIKVNSLTLNFAQGELTDLSVNVVASNLNRNNHLGTNNKATIASITRPTGNRFFALFEQLKVHLKLPGEAFANANLVYPDSVSVTIANNMAADQVTTRYGREIDEPTEDGFFEVTGSFNFPLYEEERIIDYSEAKTLISCRIECLGPVVTGATTVVNRLSLWLPEMQIATASPNVGGPGRIGLPADFVAARAASDPTGFPSNYGDNALTLDLINNINASPILSV